MRSKSITSMLRRACLHALSVVPLASLLTMPLVTAHAQAPTGKVTVVTSFSKDVTDPFKREFEKAFPGATLDVQNRNTNAGVKFLQETSSNNQVDLFWASAPDAFEVLKSGGLLEAYKVKGGAGIPERIGQFPINDPNGFYTGFAVSGYGIMWNERYVRANRLPEPKEWQDLAQAAYHDHISIAAPSRSGTTHLTLEAILQTAGWDQGWKIIKGFSGNLRGVNDRSFGVPDQVNSGQVGYGIVIDFFGFSAKGAGFPVNFVYPTLTTIVPANIGLVKNAPNAAGGKAFMDFLLSPQGQEVLFDPKIARLPVLPSAYAKAPAGTPNPFEMPSVRSGSIKFDVTKSSARYTAVDVLYDQLVSNQLEALKKATKSMHDVNARLARRANPNAQRLVAEAQALIAVMPVSEAESVQANEILRGRATDGTRQAELEQRWAAFARGKYAEAQAKLDEALRLTN
jgi:phosphoglycerate transport regulatory protein PgtC